MGSSFAVLQFSYSSNRSTFSNVVAAPDFLSGLVSQSASNSNATLSSVWAPASGSNPAIFSTSDSIAAPGQSAYAGPIVSASQDEEAE